MAETSVETVCAIAEQKAPKFLVVDSDSGMHMEEVTSAPGSVSQVA
jgi:DNA repair protein RadA/Sms